MSGSSDKVKNTDMQQINRQLRYAVDDGTRDERSNDSLSSLSSLSSIESKTGYAFRNERRTDLLKYIALKLDRYRQDAFYHLGIVGFWLAVSIITLDMTYLYSLLGLTLFIVSGLFALLCGFAIHIVTSDRKRDSDALREFSSNCSALATKNAVLMQEYIDVYDYRITQEMKDSAANTDATNDRSTQKFVSQEETEFVAIKPAEFKKIVTRIHYYIKLSTDLSKLEPNDILELRHNGVYCNVMQGATVKRCREIEAIVNKLDHQKRKELIESWNSVERRCVSTIISLPYRWITYEYRNLFRYLHSTKYMREIYANLGKDFSSFQSTVDKVNSSSQRLFETDTSEIPSDFIELHFKIFDLLLLIVDSYIGVGVSLHICGGQSWLSVLMNLLTGITLGGVVQILIFTICTAIMKTMYSKHKTEPDIKRVHDRIKMLCC